MSYELWELRHALGLKSPWFQLNALATNFYALQPSKYYTSTQAETVLTVRLTDICPIPPSDLQVIKGDTWIHISPMGKIQLYPHRWKDRGNTATGSLVLCRILSTRTALGMLTELGLESRIKEESLRFESWWYLGVGQMVHKVKIKVLVGLSSKI